MNEIVEVDVYGSKVSAVQKLDGSVWVSVRRVCEALEIDYKTQFEKLQAAPWAGVGLIPIPDARGTTQEMSLVPLKALPMWLATIDAGRVKPEARAKLILFQKEAADVLARHFFGEQSAQPDALVRKAQVHGERAFQLARVAALCPWLDAQWVQSNIKENLSLAAGLAPRALPAPEFLDVGAYLESKGLTRARAASVRGPFGKALKRAFLTSRGHEPGKSIRWVDGANREVNAYTEADRGLFDSVFERYRAEGAT